MRTAAATLAALLMLITLASYWGWAGWTGDNFSFAIGNGGFGIGTGSLSGAEGGGFGEPGWTIERFTTRDPRTLVFGALLPAITDSSDGDVAISIPLLPIVAPLLAICFTTHRIIKRRNITGSCVSCRYPRTGLPPTAPCPECGTPTTR